MHEKRYETETPGETLTRMDMMLRQMYYLERDAETEGMGKAHKEEIRAQADMSRKHEA